MVKPAGITRPATERINRQTFPQVECLPKKGSIPNGDSEKTITQREQSGRKGCLSAIVFCIRKISAGQV